MAALALAVGIAACIPQVPTPALVTKVSAASARPTLIACQVTLGWSEDQLRSYCGQPEAVVAWWGHGDAYCLLYSTSAKTFALNSGVEVIAACVGSSIEIRNSLARGHRNVEAVFGLAADSLAQVRQARP